jgi:pyruvate/2-oxoglutarate dehydrogenase complex dihydrolipoamide acyltransferase (E2) component
VDALVPLLTEDDLGIYFELLLGAVLRRASLSVRPAEAPSPPPPPPVRPTAPPAPKPKAAPASAPPKPAAAPRPSAAAPADQKAALAKINALLVELMSPKNPNLSAFKMTQRLLSKHARIPDAMFQSIYPYLEEVRDKLVPALRPVIPYQGITEDVVSRLETFCNELLRADSSQAKEEVSKKMERLPRFLEAVRSVVPH